MEDSILDSVKKQLGNGPELDAFDSQLIMNINSVFVILNQLGVGPADGFRITDNSARWSDYLSAYNQLDIVKDYVYLRVKMIFDPPASSAAMDSLKRIADEYEWRINIAVDPVNTTPKKGA